MDTVVDNIADGNDLLTDFVDEAVESLGDLPSQIDAFRINPDVDDPINAVFRAVHSIKGCAGFLGLGAIKQFSHSLENTLDDVRQRKTTLNEDLQRALIHGFDLLEEMLQTALDGDTRAELESQQNELLQQVAQLARQCRVAACDEELLGDELLILADDLASADYSGAAEMAERARRLAECIRGGGGDDVSEEDDAAKLPVVSGPTAEQFAAASLTCRVGDERQDVGGRVAPLLELFVAVDRDQYASETGQRFLDATEPFVSWARTANQNALADAVEAAADDFKTIFESSLDVDATILPLVWDQIWPELAKLQGAPSVDGEEVSNKTAAETPDETLPAAKPAKAKTTANAAKARMVRVKEERLDGFLDQVSNLFTTCELFKDLHSRMGETGHNEALVEEMRQINKSFVAQSTGLQQSIVELRRVPIAGLFSKFHRMARSLGKQLNKRIDVHISGEDTEVDKSLVEDLDSPLTHMIRNVADHAIDLPQERLERGVSETGNLWLRAEQNRTHIIITVQDDGRGIDPDKLRDKAVEKGLYDRAAVDAMSDQEAIELIFHAGLSTAEKVSDVSGRGVGLDVVRTKLEEHDGKLTVESQVGVGTTFRLEIPIRKAVVVIDGLMVLQSGEQFVLPFDHVLEITEISACDLNYVQNFPMASVRGKTYPAPCLGDLLELPAEPDSPTQTRPGVLVGCKQGTACLRVDEVVGHRQIVVNSISETIGGVDHVAGVAQLGAGRLALVLSVPDLVQRLGDDCG